MTRRRQRGKIKKIQFFKSFMTGVLPSEQAPTGGIESSPYQSVEVAVGDSILGHMTNRSGDRVDLGKMSVRGRPIVGEPVLGEPQFTAVYFRTQDGNIYKLAVADPDDLKISLTDAKKSEENRMETVISFQSHDVTNFIANNALIIGQPFIYGKGPPTGNVTEIVLIEPGMYKPEELNARTDGRTNPIKQDFQNMVYPKTKSK